MYDCMIQIGIKLGVSIFSPIQDVANNCDGAQPQIFVKYHEAVFKVKKKKKCQFSFKFGGNHPYHDAISDQSYLIGMTS